MKKCPKCEQILSEESFYKVKSTKSGLDCYCKECKNLLAKRRDYKKYNQASGKKWHEKNPNFNKSYHTNYRKNNPEYFKFKSAERRARKLNATPIWSEKKAIQEFYSNCPEGYEVDHIYPLQGKTVCGLHILENLQYLTKEEHKYKDKIFKPVITLAGIISC